jgi:CheY-like chemotaxis protein
MGWACKIHPGSTLGGLLSPRGSAKSTCITLSEEREEYDKVVNKLRKDSVKLRAQLDQSRVAAAEASRASTELVSTLVQDYETAARKAEEDFNSKMIKEQAISLNSLRLAYDESRIMFTNQQLKFESTTIVSSKPNEMMINKAQTDNSQMVFEQLQVAMKELRIQSQIESQVATQLSDSQVDIELASASIDLVVANQQQNRESKICEATRQANIGRSKSSIAMAETLLKMETLRFQHNLARHFADSKNDSQIKSVRADSKQAAREAEIALANQELRYETAAKAAQEAYTSSMNSLQEESQANIDKFNVAIVAKDLKYLVAKLTAERLEQQIVTDRLHQSEATARQEKELMISICGNVIHDLKSPLHTLLMGIESLRSADLGKGSLSSHSADLLDTLNSACAFMNSAINRTIDFTKISSGIGLTPSNTTFNLQNVLDNPFKWVKVMLSLDDEIALELAKLPEDLSTMIISDRHWMEENFLCLLSNAVKYGAKGIVQAFVTLRGDMVRITVEDRGIGIDAKLRNDPFGQQSQVQRKTIGGSGLGLYSLSKRCEAIGGLCGVDDRNDGQQGSSFWFETPYLPSVQDSLGSISEIKSQGSSEKKSDLILLDLPYLSSISITSTSTSVSEPEVVSPLHILIVDDSITVVKMLTQKLKSCGYRVVSAKNGAEGLEKMIAMTGELDLVIMDLQMPVMDGIEATARYREWENKRSAIPRLELFRKCMPIILSSANCSGDNELRAVAAGVDSFLPKPFDIAALTAALKRVLSSSDSRTSLVSPLSPSSDSPSN